MVSVSVSVQEQWAIRLDSLGHCLWQEAAARQVVIWVGLTTALNHGLGKNKKVHWGKGDGRWDIEHKWKKRSEYYRRNVLCCYYIPSVYVTCRPTYFLETSCWQTMSVVSKTVPPVASLFLLLFSLPPVPPNLMIVSTGFRKWQHEHDTWRKKEIPKMPRVDHDSHWPNTGAGRDSGLQGLDLYLHWYQYTVAIHPLPLAHCLSQFLFLAYLLRLNLSTDTYRRRLSSVIPQ